MKYDDILCEPKSDIKERFDEALHNFDVELVGMMTLRNEITARNHPVDSYSVEALNEASDKLREIQNIIKEEILS